MNIRYIIQTPFTHLQIDFIHIPKTGDRQGNDLVILDMFSRWLDVFITKREDAEIVVRILIQEIPCWGCPLQIKFRINGPAFTAKSRPGFSESTKR